MPEFLSLKNNIAIVTGASRGIGRAIALELARYGASVVLNYKVSGKAAEEVAASIHALGQGAVTFQADVADFQQAQNLIHFTIETFGDLHILVNNAGITRDTLIMMLSEQDWDTVLATNLKGTFNCSKAAIKHMLRKRYGRIVNITSIAGQMGNAGQTNYSASKAGQIGFTKALAREVAARNITVNGIAAGYIDTELWADIPTEKRDEVLKLIPLGRKGHPEEVAYAVAFLVSERAAYITGQILGIDGGMAMM